MNAITETIARFRGDNDEATALSPMEHSLAKLAAIDLNPHLERNSRIRESLGEVKEAIRKATTRRDEIDKIRRGSDNASGIVDAIMSDQALPIAGEELSTEREKLVLGISELRRRENELERQRVRTTDWDLEREISDAIGPVVDELLDRARGAADELLQVYAIASAYGVLAKSVMVEQILRSTKNALNQFDYNLLGVEWPAAVPSEIHSLNDVEPFVTLKRAAPSVFDRPAVYLE